MAIDAKLLVLDEPTLGLDILYRKHFTRTCWKTISMKQDHRHTPTRSRKWSTSSDLMFIRDGRSCWPQAGRSG